MQNKNLGQFKFKIVNSDSDNDKVFVILPGMFDRFGISFSGAAYGDLAISHHKHNTAEMLTGGYSIDAINDDGNIALSGDALTVTPSNSKFTVRHWIDSLIQTPLLCSELVVQGDNVDVFEQMMVYKRDSSFKGLGEDFIDLSNYLSTDQNIDSKIIVNRDFVLSGQSIMYMPIPAGRTVIFSFNNLKAL